MIKKGLLDFLKCLKYYFVPLGILSIFTLIGLSIGISGITSAIKHFIEEVARIAKQAMDNFDWNNVWNALLGEVTKIDFNKGFNYVLSLVFSADWLKATLSNVARAAFGDTFTIEQITALITATLTTIVMYVITFLVMIIIGIVVGIFVVKLLLRKELTKVNIKRLILYTLLDALFWFAIICVLNIVGSIASWVNIILVILFVLSFAFICLWEGYLFYARGKMPFKQVANIKNVLKLYLIELIILAITIAVSAILMLIFNIFIGFYIALPFIEIGIIAISLEAENYVVHLVEDKENNIPQPENLVQRGNV